MKDVTENEVEMTELLVQVPPMTPSRMATYGTKRNPHNMMNSVNQRAKKFGAKGRLAFSHWLDLLHEANYRCRKCGRTEQEIMLTPDHVVPLSKGGRGDKVNIQVLCVECNEKKSDKIEIYTV